MMKRTVIVGAVLAAVASVACGAQLINIPVLSTATNATNVAYALSQDGRYVGGSTADPYDQVQTAAYYDLTTSTWNKVPQQSGATPALCGVVTGVAHVAGGTMFRAFGNMNDNGSRTYGVANQFAASYDGSGNGSGVTRMGGATSSSDIMAGYGNVKDVNQAAGASARATADGQDAWMVGFHSSGTNTRGNEGYIWKGSNAATPYATALGRNSSQAKFLAVSGTGRAVGFDSGTASRTAMYANAGAGGTVTVLATGFVNVANYNSAGNSQAVSISEDGNYIGGYGYTTLSTRYQAFVWKVGDSSATILKGPDGAINTNEGSWVSAVADDGAAVGYQYSGVAGYAQFSGIASIWWTPSSKPVRVLDVVNSLGLNADGKWTSFGSSPAAIEKIGNQYYIAGNGTYNGYARAYVLVVPEPATMCLLALGGLAMLRRRR